MVVRLVDAWPALRVGRVPLGRVSVSVGRLNDRGAATTMRPDEGAAVTPAAGRAPASRSRPSGSRADRPTPTLRC